MRYFLNLLLPLLGFMTLFVSDANGQLLYTTLNSSGQASIRQTNLDGTGNSAFAIGGLAEAYESQYSNDGQLLAVTGKTVAQSQQNQISTNVFAFDPVANQTRQITNFTDVFVPSTGNRLFTDAAFKSFSPDGSVLAVASRTLFITPTAPQGDAGRTLSFFRVSDGQQLGSQIMDFNFNGTSSGGVGVSWSPVADLIAVPRSTSSGNPLLSGPTPISGFNSSGQFVSDLTSPTASGVGTQFVEHDMYPSFSPNGVALAYFRSTRFGFGPTPSALDLRITSPAGDRSILSFAPGQLPLGLSWSPDGSQLSFGVGDQPLALGALRGYEADATTASIGVVNVDGSSATPFLTAPTGFPEYFPGVVRSGDVNLDGAVNFGDIPAFIMVLQSGVFQAEADVDLSGTVDFDDIPAFIAVLQGQ